MMTTSLNRVICTVPGYRGTRSVDRSMAGDGRAHCARAVVSMFPQLEFLIGRSLTNAVYNLELDESTRTALHDYGVSLEEIAEQELDAGLGNGGLGRLAACFLDSCRQLRAARSGLRNPLRIRNVPSAHREWSPRLKTRSLAVRWQPLGDQGARRARGSFLWSLRIVL